MVLQGRHFLPLTNRGTPQLADTSPNVLCFVGRADTKMAGVVGGFFTVSLGFEHL